MLSASSVYPRSADAGFVHASGVASFPYGLQDDCSLNCFIDDAQPYDLRFPFTLTTDLDSELLLLNEPQVHRTDPTVSDILCHSEISFSSSLCQSWPHEPFPGQYLMPEMESSQPVASNTAESARSCSPASDSSTLSDAASFSSDLSFGGQTSGAGASHTGSHRVVEPQQPVPLLLPSSAGPIRRGRGRPRKDAPPIVQPPPLCTYIDPLSNTPCNKLLNRHHDLPRHMFKHCQEEAALVISGRLRREDARLLPNDWKESDEMKLPCRFCQQRFSRADAVKRHEKKEHKHRPRKG